MVNEGHRTGFPETGINLISILHEPGINFISQRADKFIA
jgi:hypothetical protein